MFVLKDKVLKAVSISVSDRFSMVPSMWCVILGEDMRCGKRCLQVYFTLVLPFYDYRYEMLFIIRQCNICMEFFVGRCL